MYRLRLLLGVPSLGVYNQNTVVCGVTMKNASEG